MSSPRKITTRVALLVVSVCGCFAGDGSDADYGYMDDDIPSGRCDAETAGDTEDCPDATESGSTTEAPAEGSVGSPCGRSSECDPELVCSAPFSEGERGEYACVEGCIGHMDELRWCADASACCHAEAVCTQRGYCLDPE